MDYADSDEEDPHEGGTGPHPINMVQAMTLIDDELINEVAMSQEVDQAVLDHERRSRSSTSFADITPDRVLNVPFSEEAEARRSGALCESLVADVAPDCMCSLH